MEKRKKDIFNPAFKELKKLFKRALKKQAAEIAAAKPQRVEGEPQWIEGRPQWVERRSQRDEEEILFNKAMEGVVPISSKKSNKILPSRKTKKPPFVLSDDEDEVITHLQNLVEGSIDMDITFSDEYVEGSIPGVSKNMIRKLKRGKIPVQDHIDLHGYTKKDAEDLVRRFLMDSQRKGYRCVLIVHGRGLNSLDSIPILKERLPVWLNRGPVRKIVMAFSSAKPYDGGTGALYVLLRRV